MSIINECVNAISEYVSQNISIKDIDIRSTLIIPIIIPEHIHPLLSKLSKNINEADEQVLIEIEEKVHALILNIPYVKSLENKINNLLNPKIVLTDADYAVLKERSRSSNSSSEELQIDKPKSLQIEWFALYKDDAYSVTVKDVISGTTDTQNIESTMLVELGICFD